MPKVLIPVTLLDPSCILCPNFDIDMTASLVMSTDGGEACSHDVFCTHYESCRHIQKRLEEKMKTKITVSGAVSSVNTNVSGTTASGKYSWNDNTNFKGEES